MAKPVWTVQQIAAQLTREKIAWAGSKSIAYSFYLQPAAHLGFTTNFSPFTAEQRQVLRDIFDLVSDVVPLTFFEVPDNGQDPGPGNERIGFHNIDSSTAPFWGIATNFYLQPSGGQLRLSGADVVVNLYNTNVPSGWDPGDRNFSTLMHEALHSLGLPHPSDYDGQGIETYESDAEYQQDSLQYTVMSYWAAWETGADHLVDGVLYHAATPLIHDIAALQKLYGANMTTRTGDTVYGFNSTAGRGSYDIGINPKPVFSIWDADGVDTLDLSGFATASRMDLEEGAFSDAGGLTKNISIAHGVTIENAVGGAGNDSIAGNRADNRLNGGKGADALGGAGGNDTLDGGSGVDVMKGGAGDDLYVVDDASDKAVESRSGDGLDKVKASASYTLGAHVEELVLTGSAISGTGNGLANLIDGNDAANVLAGKGGDDILDGGAGGDTMTGGGGNDLYIVDNRADKVVEASARGGVDTVESAVGFTLGAHIEKLVLTGTGSTRGTGNDLANSITGNASANLIDGQAGADRMIGGGGKDTYVVDNIRDQAVELAAQGNDTVQSAITWTLGAYLENLVLTGTAAIDGTGNAAANGLTGNAASNILNGKAGADTMAGGAGDDTYVVDNVGEVIVEVPGGGLDLVRSSVSHTVAAGVEKLKLTGSAASAIGNALANAITGNGADNALNGKGGADRMTGLGGDDTYYVNDPGDQVVETSARGGLDTVNSRVAFTLGANVENLTLKGTADVDGTGNGLVNTIVGNDGDNVIWGLGGNDVLRGGRGADELRGGAGEDRLSGGKQADRFVFDAPLGSTNIDHVLDFERGSDKIVLENAIFKGIGASAFAARALVVGTAAADADDRIIYNPATGALLYDPDGRGGAGAVHFAVLDNRPATLSASDFLVI